MKNLKDLITKYLTKQTQYAIQLVGPWGKGKTHYYKNVLQENITKTSTLKDNNIKYKPIYISLFGTRSIDEVQIKIFHDLLYQYFTSNKTRFNKTVKKRLNITARLMKLILKGFITYKGLGDSNEYETEIIDLGKNAIDTTDIVICFDDLERRNKDLSIEDFTGYVNNLVEENMKVLIICNEDKIAEPIYKLFKEKVVGITYEYNPETSVVITNIISTRYSSFPVYEAFLTSVLSLLVELSERNENNYRHLIYALDCLHDIFSSIKKDVIDTKKDVSEKCKQEIEKIAKFLLIVAIEFKASRLSYGDYSSMQASIYDLVWRDANENNKPKDKKIPKNKYEEITFKYYENEADYIFYTSIFSDVTGFKDFDVELFIKEFKNNYRLENGGVLPEYLVLQELNHWNAIKLSEKEYKEKTSAMIDFAKQGKYRLSEYLTIYYYSERFDNFLNIDLQELRKDIIKAMSLVAEEKNNEKIDIESEMTLRHSEGYDREQEKIRQHELQILKEIKKEKEDQETKDIIAPFLEDIEGLYDKYHNDKKFKLSVINFPVFKMINVDEFIKKITLATPFSIQFLTTFLKDRYNSISYHEEGASIAEINRKICHYLETNREKSIRSWALNEFQKTLNEIENSYGIPVII